MRKKLRKSKNIILSEKGLVQDSVWKPELKNYPTKLVCLIREKLIKEMPRINEKFNTYGHYFGYWMGGSADKVYIYIQKKKLRIDLCIGREHEEEIRTAGFDIEYVDNFQGRVGWLTGWHIPHDTKKMSVVIKWLLKAFEGNL